MDGIYSNNQEDTVLFETTDHSNLSVFKAFSDDHIFGAARVSFLRFLHQASQDCILDIIDSQVIFGHFFDRMKSHVILTEPDYISYSFNQPSGHAVIGKYPSSIFRSRKFVYHEKLALQGGAVSGDTIVVGAFLEDSNQTTITNGTTASADNSATNAGAVYVFHVGQ